MWTPEVTQMIIKGIGETLYMTLLSTALGYLFGLPMGVLLAVSDKDGLSPNPVLYKILDVIANIVRSIPFLILLILIIPFTRLLVGKSTGSTATVVPLVVAAVPFIARMVESSLKEVDYGVIEAARSMGAGNLRIMNHYKGNAGGGENIAYHRSYHCHRNHTWLFRNGRNSRWRRSGRYRYSLWVLQIPVGYHDCNGGFAGVTGTTVPDSRNVLRIQTG